MIKKLRDIGPGALVAAAFIGPGTVTVCTLAGARYGFQLLWVMVFSTVATLVLQEMSLRLGLVTGKGLVRAIKDSMHHPFIRHVAIGLVLAAILLGNAAYEAGNISGSVLGIRLIFGDLSRNLGTHEISLWPFVTGVLAFALLFTGKYKLIERSLISLVIVMSLAFLLSSWMTRPGMISIMEGLFIPRIPEGSGMTVIALIGTTVVPYNLFLHASLVQEKWKGAEAIPKARRDAYLSIILGGIVSTSIIICGAALGQRELHNAADMAIALEPLFGSKARILLATGLFAAGITSAITAPLAAAYVAGESFGWKADIKSGGFRRISSLVLLTGVVIASTGLRPFAVIRFAQFTNGLLLPLIAIFLLWVMNRRDITGNFRNTLWQNILSLGIVLITVVLGAKSLAAVLGWL